MDLSFGGFESGMFRSAASSRKNSMEMSEAGSIASLNDGEVHLLDLPTELLENIFNNFNYEQISKVRQVCRRFNQVGSEMLNIAFNRLQTTMLARYQAIKAKMPRRESARRQHPLARESDIFETLHMRLSLLQMAFGKHIERKHCCFFPGGILDEVERILKHIEKTPNLGRAYKVTDELFDLSTMAMEHFREHIEPTLPEIAYFGTDFLDLTSLGGKPSTSTWKVSDSPARSTSQSEAGGESPSIIEAQVRQEQANNRVLKVKIRRVNQGLQRCTSRMNSMRLEIKNLRTKNINYQKSLNEYKSRLDTHDKKFEESSRKFSAMLQELNKCKTELQYWRSRSPATATPCTTCNHGFNPIALAPPPIDFIPIKSELELMEAEPKPLEDEPSTSSSSTGLFSATSFRRRRFSSGSRVQKKQRLS